LLCSPRPRPHGSGARSHARLVARAWHLVAHGLASAGVRRRPHRVPTDRCGNPRQAYPSPVFFAPINGFAVHTQCWHTGFSNLSRGRKDGKKKRKEENRDQGDGTVPKRKWTSAARHRRRTSPFSRLASRCQTWTTRCGRAGVLLGPGRYPQHPPNSPQRRADPCR